MKGETKGEIFSRSPLSRNFFCVPQQLRLRVLHLDFFISKRPEGRDVMPLSSVPSRADTLHRLNWVICPPIGFIAREGDSA